MTQPRITLLATQDQALRACFQHPEGHERAAIVLFKRYSIAVNGLPDSDRYVAVAVHPFEETWVTGSSDSHIAFDTAPLREFFRRCEEEQLVFGFAHNHPTGYPHFSNIDTDNERTLLKAVSNRNGKGVSLVALLWTNLQWKARVRAAVKPENAITARHVLVTGRPLKLSLENEEKNGDEFFSRQTAAFGGPFVNALRSLRVTIVGAGGTGSPTATLLARSGIGEIIVIDPDTLEKSNLNRVRGARLDDVEKQKANILCDYIASLGLETKLHALPSFVDSAEGLDALATSDVIFGCTDDQIGREILNTTTYAYVQPYIDVGLGGQIAQNSLGHPYLRYHHGRVSTILPEAGECLFCQGVLTEQWIRRDYALRENPNLTDVEARERYLEGGGEQAPGVGPFTSAIADYGVATLYDLLSHFRKFPPELRWDAYSVDFVRMAFQSTAGKENAACPYCGTRDLLNMPEKYRLNRPALGKRDVAL